MRRLPELSSSFDDSAFNDQTFKGNNSQPTTSQDPFSDGKSRYSGLDFHEDPFKNNNYRYADPFAENSDPFGQPDSQVFGADPFSSTSSDPFKSEPSDPFAAVGAVKDNNYENSKSIKEDSFGDSDPFGGSFSASFNPAPNKDPFGSSSFGSSFGASGGKDPFSLTNLKPATPSSELAGPGKTAPAVSTTPHTVSFRKEKLSSDSSAVSEKSLKKKSSHSFSDFLTGSPLKLDKGEKKEKKEKKSGKFHLTSPLKSHKKESPSTDKKAKNSQHDQGSDEFQIKMAAEMSVRADEDRRRKLQLQEEADLAYAIALSKAEAASLKQQ